MNQWKVLPVALWLCLTLTSIDGLLQRKQLLSTSTTMGLEHRTQYHSHLPEDSFPSSCHEKEPDSFPSSWTVPDFAQLQQSQWQMYSPANTTNSFSLWQEFQFSEGDASDLSCAPSTTVASSSSFVSWRSWRIPSMTLPVISIPLLVTQFRFLGTMGRNILRNWWWSSPMALAALPACNWALFQKALLTPEWWKMTCMEYIRHSPDCLWVVSVFLLSNISYFLVAACFFGTTKETSAPDSQFTVSLGGETREVSTYSDLGVGVAACGIVSAFFHTLQAMGTSAWAEAACYMDHGFALTTFLYFWRVCGSPFQRKRVWITGVIGLGALAVPAKPGYAWLHSSWHVLSAVTALLWGLQKKPPRYQFRSTSSMYEL